MYINPDNVISVAGTQLSQINTAGSLLPLPPVKNLSVIRLLSQALHNGLPLPRQLKCFHKKAKSGMDSMFRTQFHTAVIDDTHRMVFQKQDLDDSFKDKRFPESTKVEFIFESWTPEGREGGGVSLSVQTVHVCAFFCVSFCMYVCVANCPDMYISSYIL